jgi:hypothetical protein
MPSRLMSVQMENEIKSIENVLKFLNGDKSLDSQDKERIVHKLRTEYESELRKLKSALNELTKEEGEKDPVLTARSKLRWARHKNAPKAEIAALEHEYQKLLEESKR